VCDHNQALLVML